MFRRELLLATALTTVMVGQAFADEYGTAKQGQVTIQQAASMMAYSAGNDQAQVSIAPNWSDELGWSVRAAAGSYLGDAVALGAIVEYGQDKQEYLGNLGFQLSETLSLIGTVGNLAETKEFIDGEGDDKASQMEYGLSLQADVASNLGFEWNGYAANSKAYNDSIETAMLYGTEALAILGSPDSTLVKIGGGYEWLEWDGGEKDNHWTLRSDANQQLTDMLGLQGHAKLGASERSYGGGLNLNLSDNGTNLFGVNFIYIDGRLGIADDKRVELNWTYELGVGPSSKVAASETTENGGAISAAADVAMVSPASNLLGDVMKRPAYLPERVLARAIVDGGSNGGVCPNVINGPWTGTGTDEADAYYVSYNSFDYPNGRLSVAFRSGDSEYVSQNYGDIQTNMATVFSLGGVAPTSTIWSEGGTYNVDGFYFIYWDGADTLFPSYGSLTLTFNHNGLSCSYVLEQQFVG